MERWSNNMKSYKINAIINLAGNVGIMKPLTSNRPIAALPFSGRYRIIDLLLSSVSHANIESVAMFISGSGRSIYDHVRSGAEWDLNSSIRGGLFTFSEQAWKRLDYISNEKEYDYYNNHRIFLEKSKDDYVVILGGEVIHTLDIKKLTKAHVNNDADITVGYKILETDHEGFDLVNENIVGFNYEKKKKAVNMDVYLMAIPTLYKIFDRAMKDRIFEDVVTVIKKYIFDYKVSGYEYDGFLACTGTIEDYFQVNMAMLKKDNFDKVFHSQIPIITKARSGPPAYYGATADVVNSQIATGSRIYGKVDSSIVFRKVFISENSVITNSIIMTGCKIGEDVELDYVLVDKDVVIESGVKLKGQPGDVLVIKKNSIVKKGD